MTESPLQKFQGLLRELFQFDCADLDFGIYRILNHKRDAIERFIEETLPKTVKSELQRGAVGDEAAAAEALESARARVLEGLGQDALDPDGNLSPQYRTARYGRQYLQARRMANRARNPDALATEVFNHLYSFFNRYYDNGDFISKRRYSKEPRYAIPYNGEEVLLHWANADQYYIKTTDRLHNYEYKTKTGVRVRFDLVDGDVEHDNIKGKEIRFFVAMPANAVWDEKSRTLTAPFEYRPLTDAEKTKYASKQSDTTQNRLNAAAAIAIHAAVHDAREALARPAPPRPEANAESAVLLEHHLRQYTRRNTSDFFIHKDLAGFLTRELDFYLKNEILALDIIEAGGEERADAWFELMRLLRSVGSQIIAFLAQVENLQKKLWEKRKFIVDAQYIITLGQIPTSFHEEIASNDDQWAEWQSMFRLPVLLRHARVAFLKSAPTLPLDTAHFPREFTDRLLSHFADLNGLMQGLLVHGENWQALNLLFENYRDRIQCIYIDPPFNTENSHFLFKDGYRTSTWASMFFDRVSVAKNLMSPDGSFYAHLDHNSVQYARFLLDRIFGGDNLLNEIIWRIGWVSGYKTIADRYVRNHETLLLYGRTVQPFFNKKTAKVACRFFDKTTIRGALANITTAWKLPKSAVPNLKIVALDADGLNYRLGLKSKESEYNLEDTWNCSDYESLHSNKIKRNAAEYTPNGAQITQKPEQLIQRVLDVSSKPDDLVMDHYGGSGTTAAVAIKTGRRFVTVEHEPYFDTDILWRMKKVLHGHSVGISRSLAYRGGGAVKYVRLESYEDALNNLDFDDRAPRLPFDDYEIRYMLDWETKRSGTMLNVGKMRRPFDYSLNARTNGKTVRRVADLPETFNFLIGLQVRTRRVHHRDRHRYLVCCGKTRSGRETVVIWRDIEGWAPEEFGRESAWVEEQALTDGAEVVYVNGDSVIAGAQSLDPEFKRRMFAEVPA